MSQTLEHQVKDERVLTDRWMVVIFNNDRTAYEDVVQVLIQATGCPREEAEIETWEAHHHGKAPVHFHSESTCHEVARVIGRIGVKTEVKREWVADE